MEPDPPFDVLLSWEEKANNPEFQKLKIRSRRLFGHSLKLTILPLESDQIIINYPGFHEDRDGPNQRYKILAQAMQAENLGAVVRSSNPYLEPFLPITSLKRAIDYSIDNSDLISRSSKPNICLMGFSAGASAVAAIAGHYAQVSKILLLAPSGDMPKKMVQSSLENFIGEVYIVIGENDEVVSSRAGYIYYDLASSASHRELFVIGNCDHYFKGTANDTIFERAPFYAFTKINRPTFP